MDQNNVDKWKSVADSVDIGHRRANRIVRTFFRVLSFVKRSEWSGACHATAAVLTVLLREQGVSTDLCLGEAAVDGGAFDHSWVEIDGTIFDVAIAMPLDPNNARPPVFCGIDLETGAKTALRYGVSSCFAHDAPSKMIRSIPFDMYMSHFPQHPKGLWGVAADIGESMKMNLSATTLRKRHGAVAWVVRP